MITGGAPFCCFLYFERPLKRAFTTGYSFEAVDPESEDESGVFAGGAPGMAAFPQGGDDPFFLLFEKKKKKRVVF